MVTPDNLCENNQKLLKSLTSVEDDMNELETQTLKQTECSKWREKRNSNLQYHNLT